MERLPLLYQWKFSPTVIVLCILLTGIFYRSGSFNNRQTAIPFFSSILLLLLAECSPLHYLGMHFYFSAHMIAHVVLLLICGPLLTISIPKDTSSLFIERASSVINRHSWLAWVTGVGIMWIWHIPAVFDKSFSSMDHTFSVISSIHVLSMLLAGMIFSWPVFGPLKQLPIHPLTGMVYLFTACVSCSILGLLITFAPSGTYGYYSAMYTNMSPGSHNPWGLSLKNDQQAAGLIMWVPCCFVYLSGCLLLLQRWFAQTEQPIQNAHNKLDYSDDRI